MNYPEINSIETNSKAIKRLQSRSTTLLGKLRRLWWHIKSKQK